jgi:iron complex outermembrane receptor protein
VLGLYYLQHENRNFFLEAVGPAPVEQFADRLADPSPETLPAFVAPLEFVEDRTLTREDAALFGQATLRLSDRLALTAGGRYQRDRSTDETTQFWTIDSQQILIDRAFTWKLGADIRLSGDHLVYLLASTGWKNGGNNPGALTGGALDVPAVFRPEELTALELGSRNRLAAGRAHLNATLFLYDYVNYQFIQEDPVPFSAGTGNIPAVEIRGLETELSWLPTERLRLDGQLTLLDGEIESDLQTLDVADFLASGFGRFTPTGVEDRAGLRVGLAGNEPPKLADLTSRLVLTHTRPLAGGSRLTSRLEYVYRGEYQYRVFNNPTVDTVPSYRTLGLYLGFEPADRPFTFELRVTNVRGEDGVNSRFTNPFGLHTTSEELIPPRELVLTLRYRF